VRFPSAASALAVILTAAVCIGVASAATPREKLMARYRAFQAAVQESIELLKAKKYDEAAAKLREADRLIPNRPTVHYNLACALSLGGKKDAALEALENAVRLGFANPEHMERDDDLAALRDAERFKKLLKQARKNAKVPEPLIHVPTTYKPEETRKYPLMVTLHGAGARPKGLFEAGRRALGKNKWFVAAPFGSARVGPGYTWSGTDYANIPALIDKLKKKYRIGRVYLFGFSAGAHLGYGLVINSRDHFDGFIPMAGALRRRWQQAEELPEVKGLPVYAIQGEKDNVVPPLAAKASLGILRKHGAVTKLFEHPGGHRPPKNFLKVLARAVRWIDAQLPDAADPDGDPAD
jgi:predicted peptidase